MSILVALSRKVFTGEFGECEARWLASSNTAAVTKTEVSLHASNTSTRELAQLKTLSCNMLRLLHKWRTLGFLL